MPTLLSEALGESVGYADDVIVGSNTKTMRGGSLTSFASGWRSSGRGRTRTRRGRFEFGRYAARDRQRRGLGKPENV